MFRSRKDGDDEFIREYEEYRDEGVEEQYSGESSEEGYSSGGDVLWTQTTPPKEVKKDKTGCLVGACLFFGLSTPLDMLGIVGFVKLAEGKIFIGGLLFGIVAILLLLLLILAVYVMIPHYTTYTITTTHVIIKAGKRETKIPLDRIIDIRKPRDFKGMGSVSFKERTDILLSTEARTRKSEYLCREHIMQNITSPRDVMNTLKTAVRNAGGVPDEKK